MRFGLVKWKLDSFWALMVKRSKTEEFERLAQLDVGELYRLADRPSVDRGLIYFRDFAVELPRQ